MVPKTQMATILVITICVLFSLDLFFSSLQSFQFKCTPVSFTVKKYYRTDDVDLQHQQLMCINMLF